MKSEKIMKSENWGIMKSESKNYEKIVKSA